MHRLSMSTMPSNCAVPKSPKVHSTFETDMRAFSTLRSFYTGKCGIPRTGKWQGLRYWEAAVLIRVSSILLWKNTRKCGTVTGT